MKRSRFSEEQIIGILKEHEAFQLPICAASMASATPAFTNEKLSLAGWSFGGQMAEDARRRECATKAVAGRGHAGQRGVGRPFWKEVVTPAAKRRAVAHLVETHRMSERRACKAIGCCRMTIRYQTTRADDAALRPRMGAIAQERRRFGYRRLRVFLKREGYLVNHKKLLRIHREEQLAVLRGGSRKRAIGT